MRGALLFNLTTCLCTSPSLGKNVSLKQRCENALSGFLLLDLWSLLAQEKCSKHQLPTGSTFMATQTARTLQSVALSIVVVALSKSPDFEPWLHGFGRLSELAVEHHFGMLRNQSPTALLSARAYFQAGARQSLRTNKLLNKEKVRNIAGTAPLTDAEHHGFRLAMLIIILILSFFIVFSCFSCFFMFFLIC